MSETIKQFDGPARSCESQFQIGERVVYLPEGVQTLIEGYVWIEAIGVAPRIGGYRLACGVTVSENTIARNPLMVDRKPGQSSFG